MTKKEQKYVNSLKEENERVKTLLMRFVDALGKLTNIDDVVNISLIPLMTEENKKFREEIKAEAYKECITKVKEKAEETEIICSGALLKKEYTISNKELYNLLKEMGVE